MERFVTGTGQKLVVHSKDECQGIHCVIHRPSEHSMRDFPTHWRIDRQLMERICKCGVGHPDPDDISYKRQLKGDAYSDAESVHGCCAEHCCRPKKPT